MQASLVVTLELDPESFGWLNDLRRRHFPPALNHLDAHLTLFHKVDEENIAAIDRVVVERDPQIIPLTFTGLRNLGRGIAIEVDAPALLALRAELARALAGCLIRQDQQTFRPHVTIQNNVDPAAAQALNLTEAARIAKAAEACAIEGVSEGVAISMDIEQLLYEAGRLQDAASLLDRLSGESQNNDQKGRLIT